MSLTEFYTKRVSDKYQLDLNGFSNGFFYFFGLCDNPFQSAIDKILKKKTDDALSEDWNEIGEDFYQVFKKETIDGKK